jgi:hypothetical protein
MSIRKLAAALTGLAAVLGLGLAALPAGASLSPTTVYTNANVAHDSVAGWYAQGQQFDHVYADITTNANTDTLTPGNTNGLGIQLCNPNNGRALGLGIVLNPVGAGTTNTFKVEYASGTFSPTVNPNATNGDACLEGILPSPSPLSVNPQLNTVPTGDQVRLEIGYDPKTGIAHFWGSDATIDSNVFEVTCYVGKYLDFTEPGEGVEADTANLSAPADNDLAGFSRSIVRNTAGHWGGYTVDGAWTGVRVDSTGTGEGPASLALLAPANFGASYPTDESTNIDAGTPTG